MALQSHITEKTGRFQDKTSTISISNKSLPRHGGGFQTVKANIWLKMGLYIVKLTLILGPIATPALAQAGVFSFISNIAHSKEANARETSHVSEVLGVLEAQIGPNAGSAIGGADIAMVGGSALLAEAGVIGTVADITETKSTQISLYVVRQGDSLSQIANMFGVSVNTIIWANSIKGPIREGDELVILPISGVAHKVVKGDTIRSIANKYKADIDDILNYNDLSLSDVLDVGAVVIVPDGEVRIAPIVTPSGKSSNLRNAGGPIYKDYYIRPIEGGRKSQGLHGYNGVDLAAPIGTPIYASADGVVIISRSTGYNGGYGAYVVISHANGTQTLYAHMSRVIASSGDIVTRGKTIGLVGSSGKSSGPHVHFEIRGAANPF
jgi:LysM repeat protein